jgi:hypothetical protein
MGSFAKLKYALDVAGVVFGTITGTVCVCGLVPDVWGAVGWAVSIVSAVRLFSARRKLPNPEFGGEAPSPSIALRISLASLAVFCLVFLAAMATACATNPAMCGHVEKVMALILTVVGTASGLVAMRLVWK